MARLAHPVRWRYRCNWCRLVLPAQPVPTALQEPTAQRVLLAQRRQPDLTAQRAQPVPTVQLVLPATGTVPTEPMAQLAQPVQLVLPATTVLTEPTAQLAQPVRLAATGATRNQLAVRSLVHRQHL